MAHSLPFTGYCTHAALWGQNGESWAKDRPLPDFSTAGYHQSEVPIPQFTAMVNVREHGARGDGKNDDTQALEKAIAACPTPGKVYLPPGDYLISRQIEINRSSIAIVGAGVDRTRLILPGSLVDLYPRPTRAGADRHIPTSAWSWSGGFIEFDHSQEVGIEDLAFVFPSKSYAGHFKESGSNGIDFIHCDNGWARRLLFLNADSGIYVSGSRHITLRQIEFNAYAGRISRTSENTTGHHAVDFRLGSSECLADGIRFKVKFFHELGIEHGAHGNVYSRCSGPSLVLDHHQTSVHGNLWTEINAGRGIHVWSNNAGGSTMDEVYWNIRAAIPLRYPPAKLQNIVIGMTGTGTETRQPNAPWVEVICPEELAPANLFRAQLEKRIGASKAREVLDE